MATVLRLKELAAAPPAAIFVGTPASDITRTGDTYFTNAEFDNSPGRYERVIANALALDAGTTVRVHRRLRTACVTAELHVFAGQSHADYLAAVPSPGSAEAFREIAAFIDRHLAR
jgi:monoterpene epsilon-lactone hydrolase